MKPRLVVSMLLSVLVIGAVALDVGASPAAGWSESCQYYAGSNACRRKDVASTGSSTWGANVQIRMVNPQINIDVIGESWWTVRETCNGEITHQSQYGGEVDYNDYMFWDSSAQVKHTCGGNRQGWSMGNHDFHKSGYTHIYPYKEYYTNIN